MYQNCQRNKKQNNQFNFIVRSVTIKMKLEKNYYLWHYVNKWKYPSSQCDKKKMNHKILL